MRGGNPGGNPGIQEGIQELLKAYRATPSKAAMQSPTEHFYQCSIRLDFESVQLIVPKVQSQDGTLALLTLGCAWLKCSPFKVGDLVVMWPKRYFTVHRTIPRGQGASMLFLAALRWAKVERSAHEVLSGTDYLLGQLLARHGAARGDWATCG